MTTQSQSAQTSSLQASGILVASVSISGLVLTPVAVLAGVLGVWRLGADLGWTSHFFRPEGLLSRYQLWFAVAIGARTSAFVLNRWVANQNSHAGAPAADQT